LIRNLEGLEEMTFPQNVFWFVEKMKKMNRSHYNIVLFQFYSFGDIFKLSSMVISENTGLEKLYAMVAYSLEMTK